MSRDRSIEERLRSLRRETPPAELRARILERARSIERPRLTLTDRLWHSRPLRLAWIASLAILLVLDPAVVRGFSAGGTSRAIGEADSAAIRALSKELDTRGNLLDEQLKRRVTRFDMNDARREDFASFAHDLEM